VIFLGNMPIKEAKNKIYRNDRPLSQTTGHWASRPQIFNTFVKNLLN